MRKLESFIEYLRTYFKGPTGIAEFRELFICRGDPSSSGVKDRGVVWLHGLDTYLSTFIKSLRRLREWNIYMGVGFLSEHGLTTPVVEKMLYDRLSFDFDSKENPENAIGSALAFAKAIESEYGATPVVFETGFKGAHVVVPLSRPVDWEVYQLIWRQLYSRISAESRGFVDLNMLQWNRVDRVPLTYNIKEEGTRFCRIIYPRKFTWNNFSWREFKPLDPSNIKLVKIVAPQTIKPKIITHTKSKQWIWRIIENGLPDGRKRFIFYILIPYLVNNNSNEEDILKICREFIENSCKNHNNCNKIYDSWIRSVIRSAKTHNFKGFGLSKLREKDPELYKLIEELSINQNNK
ncbi:MAG: DNA primase noncatalytic subunit PriX [Desulfurococcaceae archaeon]